LFLGSVLLFILVEQKRQVDVLSLVEVKIQVSVAASFSSASARICYAGLPNAAQPRDHGTPIWLLLKVYLNRFQQFVDVFRGEAVESSREGPGLAEKTYTGFRNLEYRIHPLVERRGLRTHARVRRLGHPADSARNDSKGERRDPWITMARNVLRT